VIQPGFEYVPGSISGGTAQDDSDPTGAGLRWIIASILPGESVVLTCRVIIVENRALFNEAEITLADQPDRDSTPSNRDPDEDDIAGIMIFPDNPAPAPALDEPLLIFAVLLLLALARWRLGAPDSRPWRRAGRR
jgi:hypothetical protein